MAGKVLKIDVAIDENGNARRAASEIESGLKKVQGTADGAVKEAIARLNEKFKETEAVVDKASDSVKQLEKNHRDLERQNHSTGSTIDSLTTMIGAYISVRAVWGAITATAAWGSELEGLSRRLKIPVDDLQRLSYAAQQNGVDIGQVGSAMATLEQKIGGDDKGAAGVLNKMGISFANIHSQNPSDLFIRIADAISRVPDPYEQARQAQELFGKQGNELIPLLTGNLRELMDKADEVGAVMSPGLAKAAADADNALANMHTTGKVLLAEFLEPALPLLTSLANKDFSKTAQSLMDLGVAFGSFGFLDRSSIMDWFTKVIPSIATGSLPKGDMPGLPPSPKTPGFDPVSIDPANIINPHTGAAEDNQLVQQLKKVEEETRATILANQQLEKQLKNMYSTWHLEAIKAIDAVTKKFVDQQREIADGSAKSLASIVQLVMGQRKVIDDLFNGPSGAGAPSVLDAQLDALTKKHEADLKALHTMALSVPADSAMVAEATNNLNTIYERQFNDLIQNANGLTTAIGGVQTASGQLRAGLTGDLGAIQSQTQATAASFVTLGSNIADAANIARRLTEMDQAYRDAGIFVQMDPDVTRLRHSQTRGLLASGGVVEPMYLARGGPAGTDTVPAYLTPGEGVLSRVGMRALDRLNAGLPLAGRGGMTVTIERGAIDARGAQFQDEASLDRLVAKLSTKLDEIGARYGAFS